MKKILVMMLIALVCLTCIACNSTEPVETKPIETVDLIEEAKEKLYNAYNVCCAKALEYDDGYAILSYDYMSLTLDTRPDNPRYVLGIDLAYEMVFGTNKHLGLPSSLDEKMRSTRALDGMQTQDCGEYTVTWNYHPDNGLKVIYEVNT